MNKPDAISEATAPGSLLAVGSGAEKAGPYAYYALGLLLTANLFNHIDRHIFAILAQAIKEDLKLNDADLGFLLGTAFAVFFGVVGLAAGRIADAVRRTRLLGWGLAIWSSMTAVAGCATTFTSLAFARTAVGIGEAVAVPCAHSLLSEYFPARNRAGAIGVYNVGTYVGGAVSLVIGGAVLEHWGSLCQMLPFAGACGVPAWRAALLILGAPGLVVAFLIFHLREPPRPMPAVRRPPAMVIASELSNAAPPFTLFNLARAGGPRAVRSNLLFIAVLAVCVLGLGKLTGDWLQWIAVSIGVYSVGAWVQVMSYRDKPLHAVTFGCPTFVFALAGGSVATCIPGAVQLWLAPYAMRHLGLSPLQTGLSLGLTAALAFLLSVVLGGLIVDRWKRRDVRAPIWMMLIAILTPLPVLVVMVSTRNATVLTTAFFFYCLLSSGWASGFAALIQDLVLPRMRGTAAAAFSLVLMLFTATLGPYWIGKISTLTGSLGAGLLSVQGLAPIGVIALLITAHRLKRESAEGRRQRAQAAGEPA